MLLFMFGSAVEKCGSLAIFTKEPEMITAETTGNDYI
jgi:hypothetical protein